ncbi:hypothetical protein KJS94_11100 [Flavihumibacter rivuli]|uniref:hypothetical protein n=1 Tax=Flavihumibacter rivuli TaxID=2838156 RepID=UPI001BDEB6B5|nr:hypothetical protein [Flavihumibacter rivuli]ULQ55188.1 hypothetical protein KJS94_11100 [Flavihumibacter rivuli]
MKGMKTMKYNVIILISMFICGYVSAQNGNTKTDKLYLITGEVKEGKVTSVDGDAIQFTYAGETLSYTIRKAQLNRIEFGSGRTEYLNEKRSIPIPIREKMENRVAILPMQYIAASATTSEEGMQLVLQQQAFAYLNQNTRELKVQDPTETNALLLKNDINGKNIMKYTTAELAALLQVEYLVVGTVNQVNGDINTNSHSNKKEETSIGPKGPSKIGVKEETQQNGFSTTTQNVNTMVNLAVYNYKGDNLFNQSRKSILTTPTAYKNTLQYLLKRTPIYKR